jgi:catecholate siderophore receptor
MTSTLQDGLTIEGKSVSNVSPNSGAVWTSYYLMKNIEIGGGLFFADRQFLTNSHAARIPGYTRIDGMLAYHHQNFDVQLNLINLTDNSYFEWGRSNAALPGRPFAAELTLRIRY